MNDAIPSPWQNFLMVVSHPFTLLQGVIEFCLGWLFTRKWSTLVLFAPAGLLLLASVALIGYGWWLSDNTLLERYALLVEEQIGDLDELEPAETPPAPTASGGEEQDQDVEATSGNELIKLERISDYTQMLLRRVLQLEKFNTRANYLVAAQMGMAGRVGQARYMMRQIAPVDVDGFAPAHAWLAVDRVRRLGAESTSEKEELLHDLNNAAKWSGTGPGLLSIYADLLESVGRVGDAIAVLTVAVQSDPELQVKLANLAYRHNRRQPLEEASSQAKQRIQERIESGKGTATDYAGMANMLLLDQKPQEAVELAQQGLVVDPEDVSLKRMLSEGYRMQYVQTARFGQQGASVNLSLLDAALKADPSNPAVTQEVARLVAMGEQASPELRAVLEQQLLSGKATAMTHIMMAMKDLKDGNLEAAIPRLEIALRQAPNSPVVLNNLSLALAKTRPEQIDRCLELIDAAVRQAPNHAEYLDTQGEIRMLAGDRAGAIESYEAAIGADPTRIGTRRQLAEAYQQFGLTDMAQAQLREIERLRAAPPTEEQP